MEEQSKEIIIIEIIFSLPYFLVMFAKNQLDLFQCLPGFFFCFVYMYILIFPFFCSDYFLFSSVVLYHLLYINILKNSRFYLLTLRFFHFLCIEQNQSCFVFFCILIDLICIRGSISAYMMIISIYLLCSWLLTLSIRLYLPSHSILVFFFCHQCPSYSVYVSIFFFCFFCVWKNKFERKIFLICFF